MFETMLEMMGKEAESVLKEKESANALLLSEWAKLFLKAYEPDKKVVYTSAYAFPMELLSAFDVVPFDFEIAGAMIASTEMGVATMNEAEDRGYTMDVCSFHRTALGASYNEYFPAPDILLTTSYYCDQKAKTNEILSLLYGKESFLLYTPSEITTASVDYVEKQLRQIGEKLSDITGQELDEDRLKEAVRSANRARRSHLMLLDLLKHRPAPWGSGQLIAFSINGLLFSGTEVKERLNEAFLRQMEKRIETGTLWPEKYRIYWFAWLPVYESNLFGILKENEVSVPLCETFRVYWDEIDEDNPFEGLALKCLKNPFVGPVTRRIQGLDRIIDQYNIDGALLFATPACRHANGAYRLLKDTVQKSGVPFLMLDMDIGDPRGYSPEQTKTRLEGFIEVLAQRRKTS
ncbi:MAG: 2-hydroxyacyl-CoA dehydratase [Candidatus Hydrogenedentota bacterium]|nr:MAG: 2-hydroxyacyl-CoA dehydratase [Candidatus Hydrogenedentota bacterium]